jgi:hypothetical protein
VKKALAAQRTSSRPTHKTGYNRLSRDEIHIRNAIGKRIFRDWRSLSRMRGLRPNSDM